MSCADGQTLGGMAFNTKKCKVMHIGPKNPRHKYEMNGEELMVTEEERDISVTVTSNLKRTAQCSKAAKQPGQPSPSDRSRMLFIIETGTSS